MSEGYNGWTNYETWVVRLYMDNERGQADYWGDAAREAYEQAKPEFWQSRAGAAANDLADQIKAAHEEACDDMLERSNFEMGPFADLLRGALSEVNWREIARHWIEAHCEEEVADA